MSMEETLTIIFREVFDDATLVLKPEMTSNDVEGWDSLSHVNLIVAIEAKFNIRFTQRELISLRNVGDLMDCIRKKSPAQ